MMTAVKMKLFKATLAAVTKPLTATLAAAIADFQALPEFTAAAVSHVCISVSLAFTRAFSVSANWRLLASTFASSMVRSVPDALSRATSWAATVLRRVIS